MCALVLVGTRWHSLCSSACVASVSDPGAALHRADAGRGVLAKNLFGEVVRLTMYAVADI